MQTLFGIPVYEDPAMPLDKPKVQLKESVQVTPAFRSEFNQWLEEFFGREYVVLKLGQRGAEKWFMNPKLVSIIKTSNQFIQASV